MRFILNIFGLLCVLVFLAHNTMGAAVKELEPVDAAEQLIAVDAGNAQSNESPRLVRQFGFGGPGFGGGFGGPGFGGFGRPGFGGLGGGFGRPGFGGGFGGPGFGGFGRPGFGGLGGGFGRPGFGGGFGRPGFGFFG